MEDYIPFIYSSRDWSVTSAVYPDATVYRLPIQCADFPPPVDARLWIDTGTDSLENWPFDNNTSFADFFGEIPEAEQIADASFQVTPEKAVVSRYIATVLESVLDRVRRVEWLSVPQLAYVDGSERNKINRALAAATDDWKARKKYKGKLILPIILTNQRQLNNKTERNGKVALAASCRELSQSDGVWVVDSSLNDQAGTGNLEKRFHGIVNFHAELSARLSTGTFTIAGPYWGLNLVLWARGLVQFPAIGVGKGYQYYIPGGPLFEGKPRLALAPLRRYRTWSPLLRKWLGDVLSEVPKGSDAFVAFSNILKNFQILSDRNQARRQLARFYLHWFKELAAVSPDSRSLALYQDFSRAYVLGKSLPDLPPPEKPRSASRVAQQFMMACL
jgi:hypothetical protein